jgi:glucose-1-phosphate cytidylyltransferase
MKIYAHYGFKDFVLCLGYKGFMIKNFFLNYEAMTRDFTITLSNSKEICFHNGSKEEDWRITFAETGQYAMTGARVRKIEKYIDGDTFMLTYGDGVADINIADLVSFHFSHGKIATISGVRPTSRFGEMLTDGYRVLRFTEKPQASTGLINGGFMVLNRRIFDYLPPDDSLSFEGKPLMSLARDGHLMAYEHSSFWQPMDTYREFRLLNKLWDEGRAKWKVWE